MAQPKHYREDLVGEGIRRAIRDGVVRREDLHVGVDLEVTYPRRRLFLEFACKSS